MRWFLSIALFLSSLNGLSDVRAGEAVKERSIDELAVIAEIARDGDFLAYGFDALWMMEGPIIVRVDGKTNAVERHSCSGDNRTSAGLGDRGRRRLDPGCGVGADLQVRPG